MANFLSTPLARSVAVRLGCRAWLDFRRIVGHPASVGLLALGLCALGVGLALGNVPAPTTRFALEAVEVYFGWFAGLAIIVGSAVLRPVGPGHRVAARFVALVLLGMAFWSVAGLATMAWQLLNGQAPELARFAVGLYVNLGWNTLHLAALAVFLQAATRNRWLGGAATIMLYAISNLAFEHPLLRFGAPVLVWSDMNGYGLAQTWQLVAGLHWTAICALLLVAAHLVVAPRTSLRRRFSAQARAVAWAAIVVVVGVAIWTLHNAPPSIDEIRSDDPVPTYSRLDLTVDVFPADLDLTISGNAVVVNRHAAPIPNILLALPEPLVFTDLSLTGDLLESGRNWRRYRLNRPLEPKETLRFDFSAHWPAPPLLNLNSERELYANGASLRIADLVSLLGEREPTDTALLHIRIGTTLDQVAVAPGQLTRTWKQEGRRYFQYSTQRPVALAATIHSGRYEVFRTPCGGAEVEAYIHPSHRAAAPRLLAAAHEALQCSRNPDQRGWVRIVETPDYSRTIGPWRMFAGVNQLAVPSERLAQAIAAAPAGVLTYSEIDAARLP